MLLCRHQPISHAASFQTLFAPVDKEQVNDLTELLHSTCGHFEKLNDGNPPRLGSWQVLWWQPRWYHAEHDGFCHQPISTTEKPMGKAEKIPYASIEEVEIRASSSGHYTEFVMHCKDNCSYAFKTASSDECTRLVARLQKLCALTQGF